MSERKERTREQLAERYYGKKALLDEWEPYEHLDPPYVDNLRRRVRGYSLQLAYRGVDEFVEGAL